MTWEAWIDKQVRMAVRMNRSRIGAMTLIVAYGLRVDNLRKDMGTIQWGRRELPGHVNKTRFQPTALGDWID